MKLLNEFNDIRQWASDRGIYQKGDIKTQLVKLQEEVGELAKAILSDNRHEIEDGIGDCVIVLTNLACLAEQHFCDKCPANNETGSIVDNHIHWLKCEACDVLNIETCINKAFNEVKSRLGMMNNGTFVKNK